MEGLDPLQFKITTDHDFVMIGSGVNICPKYDIFAPSPYFQKLYFFL